MLAPPEPADGQAQARAGRQRLRSRRRGSRTVRFDPSHLVLPCVAYMSVHVTSVQCKRARTISVSVKSSHYLPASLSRSHRHPPRAALRGSGGRSPLLWPQTCHIFGADYAIRAPRRVSRPTQVRDRVAVRLRSVFCGWPIWRSVLFTAVPEGYSGTVLKSEVIKTLRQ